MQQTVVNKKPEAMKKQASECILEANFWISCESQLGKLLVTEVKINLERYFQKYFEIWEFNHSYLLPQFFNSFEFKNLLMERI